jgi:23S rRNA (cytidine1920-2'-O)/16S rRNA (cytidine1409-2'-O)-methyltransferase
MRADVYLTQFGYAPSRSRAAAMIQEGAVIIDGVTVEKVSESIDETREHAVTLGEIIPYVGRGGLKLQGALDAFSVDCQGKYALDVGASTGGFTDCLLQHGASHVFAVDAGSGQLAPQLCRDARVTNIENCNARCLAASMLGEKFPADGVPLCVMDVSFISARHIIPAVYSVLADGGIFVCLIKPQFEVGKSGLNKKGIVKNDALRKQAVADVIECATAFGFSNRGVIESPILGGDGNTEYLACFVK